MAPTHVPPVLLIGFNRPQLTRQVLQSLRLAQPAKLYVAVDGPRKDRPEDVRKCEAVRSVAADVDWPCEVRTLFRESNLGCRLGVAGAIEWFFANEEEGIILEDDCLPSPSFFEYCATMLHRFSDDYRVMMVTGYNAQDTWGTDEQDYFFSHLGGIWGWATWRRAWRLFDMEMRYLDEALRRGSLVGLLGPKAGHLREEQFRAVRRDRVDTWDYQWGLARHINSGLSVVPTKNLVENIGFGADATHTKQAPSSVTSRRHELTFPLTENRIVVADRAYDETFFDSPSWASRVASGGRLIWQGFGRVWGYRS